MDRPSQRAGCGAKGAAASFRRVSLLFKGRTRARRPGARCAAGEQGKDQSKTPLRARPEAAFVERLKEKALVMGQGVFGGRLFTRGRPGGQTAVQKRELFLVGHGAEFAAGRTAPAARLRDGIKGLFLVRGHGSGRLELLCARTGTLARD